jgi:hypothetical protein
MVWIEPTRFALITAQTEGIIALGSLSGITSSKQQSAMLLSFGWTKVIRKGRQEGN